MNRVEDTKPPIFFTVDLEDFSFDLCRSIGTTAPPKLRYQELRQSYLNIKELLPNKGQPGSNITFFCTGVMADRYPKLIEEIAQDGHEIACHGNFHEKIFDKSAEEIYSSLCLAKQKLSEISQSKIRGFRAPYFSIEKNDFERLNVISRLFEYDSSLHFTSDSDFDNWKEQCQVDLLEFPVPCQKSRLLNIQVKTGGSYLKLLPVSFVKNALNKSLQKNIMPILYLHPYETYYGYRLLLNWSELKGARSRFYWYFRQLQWAGMFNWTQKQKLQDIFKNFDSHGRLDSFILGRSL